MAQPLELFYSVALKRVITEIPILPGTRGAIVNVNSSDPPGSYLVEFIKDGETLGVYDVSGDDLELIEKWPREKSNNV